MHLGDVIEKLLMQEEGAVRTMKNACTGRAAVDRPTDTAGLRFSMMHMHAQASSIMVNMQHAEEYVQMIYFKP